MHGKRIDNQHIDVCRWLAIVQEDIVHQTVGGPTDPAVDLTTELRACQVYLEEKRGDEFCYELLLALSTKYALFVTQAKDKVFSSYELPNWGRNSCSGLG